MMLKKTASVKVSDEEIRLRVGDDSTGSAQPGKPDSLSDCSETSAESNALLIQIEENDEHGQEPCADPEDTDALRAVAMDPHATESNWLEACDKLNQLSNRETSKGKGKGLAVKPFVILAAAASILTIIFASSSGNFSTRWAEFNHASTIQADNENKLSYVQEHAQWRSDELKERLTVRLAVELERKEWSADKAAGYFSVDKNMMNDLLSGKHKHAFSIDQLNKMLFAIGLNPVLPEEISSDEKSDSIRHYTRAIKLNPKNQHAYWRRGVTYSKLGNYDSAIADMTRSMELYPNRPWLIEKRARVYVKAGKYNLALRDANQLVSQFPQSDGQELRAEIWQSMKQYDKALLDYNNSIAKMPNASPDRYSNRARIYERLGMYQEAICDLETVLQIDPNESEAADAIARLKVLNRS